MNWGDVVLAVRTLHLELLQQFKIQPRLFVQDLELNSENFPFPKPNGDIREWEWNDCEPEIQEALEMHAVERVLLEGPLLPIECISFSSEQEVDALEEAILKLELQWIEKSRMPNSSQMQEFIQASLKQKWIRVRARSGLKRLKAV